MAKLSNHRFVPRAAQTGPTREQLVLSMEEKDATIVALGAQIAARAAENAEKDAKIAALQEQLRVSRVLSLPSNTILQKANDTLAGDPAFLKIQPSRRGFAGLVPNRSGQ